MREASSHRSNFVLYFNYSRGLLGANPTSHKAWIFGTHTINIASKLSRLSLNRGCWQLCSNYTNALVLVDDRDDERDEDWEYMGHSIKLPPKTDNRTNFIIHKKMLCDHTLHPPQKLTKQIIFFTKICCVTRR